MCCPHLPVCKFIHLARRTRARKRLACRPLPGVRSDNRFQCKVNYCICGLVAGQVNPQPHLPHSTKENFNLFLCLRQTNCCRISVSRWLARIHRELQEAEKLYSKRRLSGICLGMKKSACRWHWVWPYDARITMWPVGKYLVYGSE